MYEMKKQHTNDTPKSFPYFKILESPFGIYKIPIPTYEDIMYGNAKIDCISGKYVWNKYPGDKNV